MAYYYDQVKEASVTQSGKEQVPNSLRGTDNIECK